MAPPAKPKAPAGDARKPVKARAIRNRIEGAKRFGGLQVVALLVGFAQGFALLPTSLAVDPPPERVAGVAPTPEAPPEQSRTLVGAFQIFSGVFVLWLGFTTIGSMIALFTQAEDETMLVWAALGGALGGLVKQFAYKSETWNLFFTLGVQWGVTLGAAGLKFGILKIAG